MTGEWERTLAGQLVEAGLGRAEADGLARGAAEEARDASRDPQEPYGPAVAFAATLVSFTWPKLGRSGRTAAGERSCCWP
jgi:hypothetical protein